VTSVAFLDAHPALEEEAVRDLFGLKVVFACLVAGYGLSQSGMDITVCNSTAPTPCSAPPAGMAPKMKEIVGILRVLWGDEFDSNYKKYMLGATPAVVLIPRTDMIRIANARPDSKPRNGETTQGLNLNDERIVAVYDDIAPLLVVRTINHEIGHQNMRDKALLPNDEEARVRKVVDTAFFARVFGRRWLESTIAALEKRVRPVEKNGRVYNGHTPQAVAELYDRIESGGRNLERNTIHDRILETLVFILTNTEESLSAALDADDSRK
jgi:hypothetical protein